MPEVGERYLGTVVKTTTFGAFVSLLPGKDGLLHISQIRKLAGGKRVENVEDVLEVGEKVQVEIAEIDPRGKLSLVPGRRGARPPRRPAEGRGDAPARRSGDAPASQRRRRRPCDRAATMRQRRQRTRTHVQPGADGRRAGASHRPAGRSARRHRDDAGRALGRLRHLGRRRLARRVPSHAGATHFLEHLLFKGTPTRTALEISAALDAVGGEMNAFTAKEYTCYYARVLDDDLPLAVDVICDMVTSSLIAPTDVEAERGVILEEIAMHDDDPTDVVHDAFAGRRCSATRRSAGRSLGTVESIARSRRAHRRLLPAALHARQPGRRRRRRRSTTTSVVRLVAHGVRAPGWATPAGRPARAADRRRGRRTVDAGVRSIDAADRAGQRHPRRRRARPHGRAAVRPRRPQRGARRRHVSRLFQEIREKRGLAYSVYSFASRYADTGTVRRLRRLPARQGRRGPRRSAATSRQGRRRSGITEDELERGKGQLRGALVLGLEDTGSRMSRIGKSELVYGSCCRSTRSSPASRRSRSTTYARSARRCSAVR